MHLQEASSEFGGWQEVLPLQQLKGVLWVWLRTQA